MREVAPEPISRAPCPFCGSTFAGKVSVKNGFRLQCPCCDAQTGVATRDDILKAYWERRPLKHAAAQGSAEMGPAPGSASPEAPAPAAPIKQCDGKDKEGGE